MYINAGNGKQNTNYSLEQYVCFRPPEDQSSHQAYVVNHKLVMSINYAQTTLLAWVLVLLTAMVAMGEWRDGLHCLERTFASLIMCCLFLVIICTYLYLNRGYYECGSCNKPSLTNYIINLSRSLTLCVP